MHLLNDQQRASRYSSKSLDIHALLQEQIGCIYDKYYKADQLTFDYSGFAQSKEYQTYRLMLSGLHRFDISQLKVEDKKTSFWLNIYNMLCIHIVIKVGITRRIDEHNGFFSQYGYSIGGKSFSLDDIEHGILRANRKAYSKLNRPFKTNDFRLALACKQIDPKIHFGLYCASISSPKLVLFEAGKLDEQLKENTAHCFEKHIQFNEEKGVINIPKNFKWYANDLGNTKLRIIEFIAAHTKEDAIKSTLLTYKDHLSLKYLDFKWALNKI